MTWLKTAPLVLLVVVTTIGTDAEIRPSFRPDPCSWNATDIVVASEGDKNDGSLTVVEVWDGGLAVGDSITLPELAELAAEEKRKVRSFVPRDDEDQLVVSAQRMVLFLRRAEDDKQAGIDGEQSAWEPASRWGGMEVSVAWIDQDRVYARQQIYNPGPTMMSSLGFEEGKFKEYVIKVVELRDELAAVAALDDQSEKAKAALPYTESPNYLARTMAFHLLTESGEHALSYLRSILKDLEKQASFQDAVKALAAVGGQAVAKELTAIVQKELAFWQETAPDLEKGWWNGKGLEWDTVGRLRDRYGYVLEVFYALRKIKSPECREAVRAFRDYWRSMPQLEDKSGLTQMSEACDAVLNALESEK